MIPLKYTIRNLVVRLGTTLHTALAIGLVVWASVLTFGLVDGLEHAITTTGDPLDLIVLRKGANDETSSIITSQTARELANLPGIVRTAEGQTLCSNEYVTILTKPRRNNGGRTNLIVRGLDPVGRQLRPGFRIVEGRDLKPGVNEAITSRSMAQRFENLGLGEKVEINKIDFTIVGIFEAGGSAAESELWTDARDLTGARRSPGAISVVNLRALDGASRDSLVERIRDDEQFKLKAIAEPEYYEDQKSASIAIKFVGYVIAGFLTVGAMFAAANTMYSAVASRGREIGTLRAIGFRRRSVVASFLLESLIICTLGGVLGCLATLPFNGLSTGTANWATFSEITFSFRFGTKVLLQGMCLAIAMGVLGGLFPALRSARVQIIESLRQR